MGDGQGLTVNRGSVESLDGGLSLGDAFEFDETETSGLLCGWCQFLKFLLAVTRAETDGCEGPA